MARHVIQERMRGFVSLSAHPVGCAEMVARQAAHARRPAAARRGGNLLVLGGSTGYGLASRIAGAFGHGMHSVGVFYERPPSDRRTASAGWYNTAAFDALASQEGLRSAHLNGDAFSAYLLERALEAVTALGPLDVVVYSLAAPQRKDPLSGVVHKSVLKTIGEPFTTKSIDLDSGRLSEVTLEPASEEEMRDTVAVMGGTDLRRWVRALLDTGLLAPAARVVAYSYLGPEVTWPVYRHGTIGLAKEHLEQTCDELHEALREAVGGSCRVAFCKSIVSQASAAIPAVPLYMSLLFRVMKDAGTHEGPIEQMTRLFEEHVGPGRRPTADVDGRIRLDDREMRPEIQEEVMRRWRAVRDDNLDELADFAAYRRYFDQLFGFSVPGVAYDEAVETEVPLHVVE